MCECSSSARRAGIATALEELYLIHFDRIYSYLHLSVGNRHDAEDLTTQTFLKMLEAIGPVPVAVGPVLGLALPDRPQPRDRPLPRAGRVQAEDEVPEVAGLEESSAEEQAMDSLGQAGCWRSSTGSRPSSARC